MTIVFISTCSVCDGLQDTIAYHQMYVNTGNHNHTAVHYCIIWEESYWRHLSLCACSVYAINMLPPAAVRVFCWITVLTQITWTEIGASISANLGNHCFINSKRGDSHWIHNSNPSQAKVLTGGRDLREAKVDVPLSVSHSCVWPHCWAQ